MTQNSVTVNLADFEEQLAKGLVSFSRLDTDLYQFVFKRFKRDSGERDRPDIIQVNRAVLGTLVTELLADNERMHAQISRNEQALRVLGEILPAAIEQLDVQAAAAEAELAAALTAARQDPAAPKV